MSNIQLYLSVGLPVLAILISLLIQLQAVSSLRSNIDKRMEGFDKRMDNFEKRMDRFEDALNDMRRTFIKDHTERLVRLEERVFHA